MCFPRLVLEDLMRSPPVDNRPEVEQMCRMLHTAATTYISHSTTKSFAKQITEAFLTYLKGEGCSYNVYNMHALTGNSIYQSITFRTMIVILYFMVTDRTVIYTSSYTFILVHMHSCWFIMIHIGSQTDSCILILMHTRLHCIL